MNRLIAILVGIVALSLAVTVWSIRGCAVDNDRANTAETRADSIEKEKGKLEDKSRADSIHLANAIEVHAIQEREIVHAREVADRDRASADARAKVAAVDATHARGALRAVLDSLGASQAPLDSLVAAHARELEAANARTAAADARTVAADSLAAAHLTLLTATQTSLASESASRRKADDEIATLRVEVKALKGRSRWGKVGIVGGLTIGAEVVSCVLSSPLCIFGSR